MPLAPVEQLEPLETDTEPKTVLIVEDEESIAEVLSIRLEKQGFRTHIAQTGHEGLEWARERRPDLVLLDLHLPDHSGLDICQELADGEETAGVPVIVLSGMTQPDIIRQTRAAGCQFYVRKPYDPNVLLVLIRRALCDSDDAGFE